MRRAVDVAAYILSEKGRLSGYQLQKLLYYRPLGVVLGYSE